MSFQTLPKELKQLVVDTCKAIDQRRRERFHYAGKRRLRFELVGALSLVNKELRAMAVKYAANVSLRFGSRDQSDWK